MSARANQTVYWPGMNSEIRHHRTHCESCNQILPAQSAELLVQSPASKWPFQQMSAQKNDFSMLKIETANQQHQQTIT